ncbi:uncharacterized protein LOC111299436 isoform X2 [Durio zibethinus]|uniref:Uncharacterized protein LOC111299436 isoform X2 n=1 Tax=Durio zibethinus TaxID=66656 RepID=A0A6P5ZBX8_DURZI|nr:uncharacterized protein LOC111299436 isoform X2 [Durio zibethinus]
MPSPLSTVIAVSLCSPLHRVGHFWNLPLAYYLVGSFFLFVHHDKPVGIVLHQSISVKAQMDIGIARTQDTWHPPYLLHRFSTGFVSVHGERPSAVYAKLRKESLESELGHIIGMHISESVSVVYGLGPFFALYRAAIISFHFISFIEVDDLAILFSRHKTACFQAWAGSEH